MSTWLRALPVAILVGAGLGCEEAITQPRTPTPIPPTTTPTRIPQTPTPTGIPETPTATPIPPTPTWTTTPRAMRTPVPFNLNGSWSGTFREGNSSKSIHATVRHEGSILTVGAHVTIGFSTSQSSWEFRGTYRGAGLLTGALFCCVPLDDQFAADLRGQVTATEIPLDSSNDPYFIHLSR